MAGRSTADGAVVRRAALSSAHCPFARSMSQEGRRIGRPRALTMPWTVTAVAAVGSVDGEQVGHLERGAGRRGEGDVYVDDVVEAQRSHVAHVGLQHRGVLAVVAPFGVGVADVAEVADSRLLEVREVAAVVDDAHGVGLGEAHPDPVTKRVGSPRRSTVPCRCASPESVTRPAAPPPFVSPISDGTPGSGDTNPRGRADARPVDSPDGMGQCGHGPPQRAASLPEPITTVDDYLADGGGEGLRAARALGPQGTIEEIIASGLRGRGGAGFPTGAKWSSVRAAGGGRHYAAANGAEGEPATFKDRTLMRLDPYRVVEGLAIAAFCVDASGRLHRCETVVHGRSSRALRRAAVELGELGLLGELAITIVEGPDEYLFGEEKALLGGHRGPRSASRDCSRRTSTGCSRRCRWVGRLDRRAAARRRATRRSSTTSRRWRPQRTSSARGASWYRSMGTAASPGSRHRHRRRGRPLRPVCTRWRSAHRSATSIELCGGPQPGRTH